MVCMGGPFGNWTPNPNMRHRIDTESTVCCTQYTPWPLTHPHCAPASFSFYIARDRRNEKYVRKRYIIWHLSQVFKCLLIAMPAIFFFNRLDTFLSFKSMGWCWHGSQTWFLVHHVHTTYAKMSHCATKFLIFCSGGETNAQIVEQQDMACVIWHIHNMC